MSGYSLAVAWIETTTELDFADLPEELQDALEDAAGEVLRLLNREVVVGEVVRAAPALLPGDSVGD